MSLDNKTLDYRIYHASKDVSLEKTVTSRIIHTYIQVCIDELIEGRVLRAIGLFCIRPNIVLDSCICTTAMLCKKVADIEGLSYYAVYSVIRSYLDECKTDIINGTSVVFLRLIRITPIVQNGKTVDAIAVTSSIVREQVLQKSEHVTSVRANVCKILKSELKALV